MHVTGAACTHNNGSVYIAVLFKALYDMLFIHLFPHTLTHHGADLLTCRSDHLKQFEVRCFAQGHLNMNRTTNPVISGRAALLTEPQPPWLALRNLLLNKQQTADIMISMLE